MATHIDPPHMAEWGGRRITFGKTFADTAKKLHVSEQLCIVFAHPAAGLMARIVRDEEGFNLPQAERRHVLGLFAIGDDVMRYRC